LDERNKRIRAWRRVRRLIVRTGAVTVGMTAAISRAIEALNAFARSYRAKRTTFSPTISLTNEEAGAFWPPFPLKETDAYAYMKRVQREPIKECDDTSDTLEGDPE
jgi:hypothetical protein